VLYAAKEIVLKKKNSRYEPSTLTQAMIRKKLSERVNKKKKNK